MNRQKLNLVLAAVALALGAGVWLSQKKEETKPPLTALKSDAITHIALEHEGKPRIVLAKTNGNWALTEPVAVAADALAVNTLLGIAEAPVQGKLDAQQVKPADIGLEPPLLTLKLDDTLVQFGGTEPLNYRRYVRAGDTIALIDDVNGPAFDADYSDLVSKALLPDKADIQRIELPGLTVARDANGKGWTTTPAADAALAQALADHWLQARAMWTQAAEPGEPKGEPVKIVTKDKTCDFLVVARDPQLTIENPALKLRYVLSKADTDKLLKLEAPKPAATQADAPSTAGGSAAEAGKGGGDAVPPPGSDAAPKPAEPPAQTPAEKPVDKPKS